MSQIISHTPTWVFVIFFVLLALGLMQSKEREVKVFTVFILPIAMLAFSIFGVYSAVDISLLTVGLWGLGLLATLFIGIKLAYPKLVCFSSQNNQLTIPGSWVPLILMMAIFMTKFFVGFAMARDLPIIDEIIFMALLSLLYGVFSGIFLSRGFVMFKAVKHQAS